MEPLISVIIPVYNTEKYLRQCLDTVVNQTLKDLEIILIDDGSTDRSLAICHEYARKDKRIQVYTQQNCGAGAARNRGMKLAKGTYLSFLDSDDFFELDMLEKLYAKCIKTNSEICACRSKRIIGQIVGAMPWTLRTEYLWQDNFSLKDLFYSEHLYQIFTGWAWDKLFKRSLIDKYHIQFGNLHHSEDLVFVFPALAISKQITIIEDELVFHRYHSTSLGHQHDEKPEDFMNAIFMHYDSLMELGIYEKCRNSYIRWVQSFSSRHYGRVLRSSARKEVIKCIDKMAQKLFFDKNNCFKNIGKPIMPPKISVLIPVYNVEKYLDEAIQSVLCQTLYDIEIICINDGSTDHSLEILQRYQKLDSRIRIINKENTGYGHSMNIGLQVACGEYIAILEPDDYILPNMYELLYQKAKQFNLDFIKSDYYRFTGPTNNPKKQLISVTNNIRENYNRIIDPQKEYDIPCELRNWCGIYNHKFLVKNRILYNETPGASYQDNGFFIKTFCRATKIMLINQVFYMYRCDNTNASVRNTCKIGKLEEEYKRIHQWIVDYSNNHKSLYVYFYRKIRSYLWVYDTEDSTQKGKVCILIENLLKKMLQYQDIMKAFFSKKYTQKLPKHHVDLINQIIQDKIPQIKMK